jgi:hypothetical protein
MKDDIKKLDDGRIFYTAKVIKDLVYNPYRSNYYENSLELFCPYCGKVYEWEECNIIFNPDNEEKYESAIWRIIKCKSCNKKFEAVGRNNNYSLEGNYTAERMEDRIDLGVCPKCEGENRKYINEKQGYVCKCGEFELVEFKGKKIE